MFANRLKLITVMRIQSYGHIGKNPVDLYTLTNKNGIEVKITNYGGIITSFLAPDRNGNLGDIVLGRDSLDDYVKANPFFGCLVGRMGNRIANGRFTLNGVDYKLLQNDGDNHLHGGKVGFDKVVWQTHEAGPNSLALTYLSRDGEEGYPGNLYVTVIYALSNDNALRIHYTANTDQTTILNLTNHTYFNLSGAPTILDHDMQLFASRFTPGDKGLIPTGELQSVDGTPMDFRQSTRIGDRIDADYDQLNYGGGYDHNYVVDGPIGTLRPAARASDKSTGRVLETTTTEPAIQFYAGNFLDGSVTGKGRIYNKRSGFCLETQHIPDSPNQPSFPTVVLTPEQTYTSTTVYKVSVAS